MTPTPNMMLSVTSLSDSSQHMLKYFTSSIDTPNEHFQPSSTNQIASLQNKSLKQSDVLLYLYTTKLFFVVLNKSLNENNNTVKHCD